jgi:ferric-dicitrate binding protein FerR (iron transport regulator)
MKTRATDNDETLKALTPVLVDALCTLGESGRPETANRLAGRAWAALRQRHPAEAQRVNALMHRLARMPSDPTHDQGAPQCPTHNSTSAPSLPPAATS